MKDALVKKIITLKDKLKIPDDYFAYQVGLTPQEYHLLTKNERALNTGELLRSFELLGLDNLYEKYCTIDMSENKFKDINFIDPFSFNFGSYVDLIAQKKPNNLALLHIDCLGVERRFTFRDIRDLSAMSANYFQSLGIKKGDRVMLILRNSYELWPIIIGLHKLGATVVPSTHMLKTKDIEYRIQEANITSIISIYDYQVIDQIEKCSNIDKIKNKICLNGRNPNWYNYDLEVRKFGCNFNPVSVTKDDAMIIFFTSGTTSKPKGVVHNFSYPLAHIPTAKFWHASRKDGLHYTVSDSGWAKFFWGKIYGEWLCEAPIIVDDNLGKFNSDDLLHKLSKYQVTSFCGPATTYRMLLTSDLSKYDLSSISSFTVAGETLAISSYNEFCKQVNNEIRVAYGMTEAAMLTGNFYNEKNDPASIGSFNPLYEHRLLDNKGNITTEEGQLIVKPKTENLGILMGYLQEGKIVSPLKDGFYYTSDIININDNGKAVFIGRNDDMIKTSGYKVAPAEVEEVLMELPSIKECAVIGTPDAIRGMVVTALVVLNEQWEESAELKDQIQKYVKIKTSSYKYPRRIIFTKELPKTISGKIDKGLIKKLNY